MRDLKIAGESPENVYDHYDIYFMTICGRNDRIVGFDNQSPNALCQNFVTYHSWDEIFLRSSHGIPEEALKHFPKLGETSKFFTSSILIILGASFGLLMSEAIFFYNFFMWDYDISIITEAESFSNILDVTEPSQGVFDMACVGPLSLPI
ncbi:hypothetical protein BGAL_0322g00070 [Botrytis galanthina]|uniref:Uncharacterized protein n=1 Tax=Botrytis galanthina TaxID=278940 RepID=A0A4V4HTY8_9HELO|nr:hypothetical protein BGAL_0322g00070 [Botrytis galanthina]